jgi:hypothetical protein
MDLKLSEPGQICLQELSEEELAKLIARLIREGGDLSNAVLEVVWSCPNIVTEI